MFAATCLLQDQQEAMAALYKQEGTKRQLETVGLSSLRALAVVQQAALTGAHNAEQSAEAGLQQSLAEAQGEALRQAQSLRRGFRV